MAIARGRALRALLFGVLFCGAVGAGIWASAAFAPERVRVATERALTDLFGTTRVGALSLGWSQGPAVVAHSIQVSEADAVVLLLDRVELRLDLLRLFRGDGRFDRLKVRGVRLKLVRLADGGLRPERLDRMLRERGLPGAGEARVEIRDIEILDGRIELLDDASRAIHSIESVAMRVRLRPTLEITLRGRIGGAPFQLRGEGPKESRTFQAAFERVTLDDLRPWWFGDAHLFPALDGVLAVSARGVRTDSTLSVERLEAELGSASFEGRPLPFLRVGGALEFGPERVEVRELRLSADAAVATFSASLPRERGANATVDALLETQRLDLYTLRDHIESLGLDPIRPLLESLESGLIESVRIEADDAPWDALDGWTRDPTRWPEGLRLEASFRDVAVPLEGEPLREFRGRLEVGPEQLGIRDVHALIGDRPLPELDLTIEGWSRLAASPNNRTLSAVPPLPGRVALMEWLEATRKPVPGWQNARVELDWIDHPVLLRPVERVAATLRPLTPGIEVDLHGARWGDVWVSGRGAIRDTETANRIELALRTHASAPASIGDRVESVVRNAPMERRGDAWSAGRADVALTRFGVFGMKRAVLSFEAVGTALRSEDVTFDVDPKGLLRGNLDVELGVADAVPYRASFQVADGDLTSVLEDLGARQGVSEGRLVLAADLHGHLRAGEAMLASLRGPISAQAREGLIRQRVPWALAIAAASETLNPFRSRETIPYDAISAEFELVEGHLEAKALSITGPTIRLVATGSLYYEADPSQLEAVVGLFFFRGLDRLIDRVPILNTLLLGEDDNFVAAYFSVEGPWNEPKADLIPVKSFLDGPGSLVAQGVPSFVKGGLAQLGRVFVPGRRSRKEE